MLFAILFINKLYICPKSQKNSQPILIRLTIFLLIITY